MCSLQHVPLTPPRKRAACGAAELRSYQLPTTSNSISGPQFAPDLHSVPELDWGESPESTPESTEYFPRTPSTHDIPSQNIFIDKKKHCTPTRPFKTRSRADHIKGCKPLDPVHSTTSDRRPSKLTSGKQKQAPLFAPSLYPLLPPLPSDLSYLVRGDVSRMNFDFFQLSRSSNPEVVKSPIQSARYGPKEVKEHTKKRIKKEEPPDQEVTRHTETAAVESSQVSFKVETTPDRVALNNIGAKSMLAGVKSNKFSRILPWQTIDRLWEDPSRCVASLVNKPNKRCSKSTGYSGDLRGEVVARISELEDSSNLIDSKDYIQELIKKATCTTYHRKIAEPQLQNLLDHYCERRNRRVKSKYDFTKEDIEDVPYWLEALTTLPNSATTIEATHAVHETNVSTCFANSVVYKSQPIFKDSVTTDAVEKEAASQARNYSPKELLKYRKLQERKAVEATQSPREASHHRIISSNMLVETTCTRQTSHEIERTASIRDNVQTFKKRVNLKTTHTADTTQKVGTSNNGTVATHFLETTETVTTIQKTIKSSFHPPSVDGIKFITEQTTTVKLRRSRRIAARAGWLDEQELSTLHQSFSLSKNGRGLSVQALLKKCLIRPLTLREYEKPLEKRNRPRNYPGLELNYPGQGLIYMYWIPGNFGFVKIGKTSGKSTEKRLKQWKSECGHPVQEHTRGEAGVAIQIPHAHRVEALVHAELKEVRIREEQCGNCGRAHEEWFAVPPVHAMKVIDKWSDFMLRRPYVESNGEWGLKKSFSKDIRALCTPTEMPVRPKIALPALLQHASSDVPAKKGKGAKNAKGRKKSDSVT